MSAWSNFKNNPSISNYLAWVRESYGVYADELEAQDVGVGSDVALLAGAAAEQTEEVARDCLLYTSPSPRDKRQSRMPSSA